MSRTLNNHWLHRFAVLTAAATLLLICVGGVVTSKGVGMSVPDWPTTYGYNMFLFPPSKWVGGIFYEHTHRLVASTIGFLTIILAVWLWLKDARRWMRWLGVAGLLGVILQGVLGGLRVTQLKDELGIFHAALAQLFFVLVSAIALFTSRWWRAGAEREEREALSVGASEAASLNAQSPSRSTLHAPRSTPPTSLYWLGTALIFVQLVLGATMRHQHAGLAISDFPLAHHQIWPAMDPASVARYNQERLEVTAANPITAFQVGLQMVHRMMAGLILAAVFWAACSSQRRLGWKALPTKLSMLWCSLILCQVLLGAATIWSNKSADIATAHVGIGALSLMIGAMTILVMHRGVPQTQAVRAANLQAASSSLMPLPEGKQAGGMAL